MASVDQRDINGGDWWDEANIDFILLHERSDQGTLAKAGFALGFRDGFVLGKENMVKVLDAGGEQITESFLPKGTEANAYS